MPINPDLGIFSRNFIIFSVYLYIVFLTLQELCSCWAWLWPHAFKFSISNSAWFQFVQINPPILITVFVWWRFAVFLAYVNGGRTNNFPIFNGILPSDKWNNILQCVYTFNHFNVAGRSLSDGPYFLANNLSVNSQRFTGLYLKFLNDTRWNWPQVPLL